MKLWSRRSLFAGLGGAAAATVATQLPAVTASAATSGATIQLIAPPLRIADTRSDGTGIVTPTHPLDVFVPGLIGAGSVGALLNLTVTETIGAGFITATADNASGPNATSNCNWSATGQTVANLALIPAVGTRGITITVGGPGQTHVVVDLVGLLVQP
jgi:hypothetical protein